MLVIETIHLLLLSLLQKVQTMTQPFNIILTEHNNLTIHNTKIHILIQINGMMLQFQLLHIIQNQFTIHLDQMKIQLLQLLQNQKWHLEKMESRLMFQNITQHFASSLTLKMLMLLQLSNIHCHHLLTQLLLHSTQLVLTQLLLRKN